MLSLQPRFVQSGNKMVNISIFVLSFLFVLFFFIKVTASGLFSISAHYVSEYKFYNQDNRINNL